MSRTEASSIEIGGGLALFAAGGGARSPARSPIGGARSPAAHDDQDQVRVRGRGLGGVRR